MRTLFIDSETVTIEGYPAWAAYVVAVDGGWMAFESRVDLDTWLRACDTAQEVVEL